LNHKLYRNPSFIYGMLIANEKRLAEIQLETLRRQLNPHFTFNAINSLQYFILNNDTELALDYLYKLSGLIRQTLDHSGKLNVSLAEEIDYLKLYMTIENIRIQNRVTFAIKIGEDIDIQSSYIPSMILHPFIENSFLHSFPVDHPNPKIDVHFQLLEKDYISCTIKDNGVGFDLLQTSSGIRLVKERLHIMSSQPPHSLEVISLPNEGTSVKICLQINAHLFQSI